MRHTFIANETIAIPIAEPITFENMPSGGNCGAGKLFVLCYIKTIIKLFDKILRIYPIGISPLKYYF